jgi:hypothetical protein
LVDSHSSAVYIVTYDCSFFDIFKGRTLLGAPLLFVAITDRALHSEYEEAHVPYGCWAFQGIPHKAS